MKIALRLILSLLFGTALVLAAFTWFQVHHEENRLDSRLRLRAAELTRNFQETVGDKLGTLDEKDRIQKFLKKYLGRNQLLGLILYRKDGHVTAWPPELSRIAQFQNKGAIAAEYNTPVSLDTQWLGRYVNLSFFPLLHQGTGIGALGSLQDRTFIIQSIIQLWKISAVIFLSLAVILSITTLLIIRASVTNPISRIDEMVRKSTYWETPPPPAAMRKKDSLEKLMLAVNHMAASLKAARLDLTEQSRIINAEGTIWTKERLKDYLLTKLEGKQLYVITNREPYVHQKKGDTVECITPPSGVVTALDPVMRATGGMWIAQGTGNADREMVDNHNQLKVPPWKPSYTLKRVWLSREEEKGFYYGFSNEGLWPLCHISHVRPIFRMEDWKQYQKANQIFADALLEELDESPAMILIQDYHFAMLPKLLKDERPDVKIALFWHIPWPNPEAFGICPWQKEILEGMLGSDLIGFHTQYHCNNFLDTVNRVLESRIDRTTSGVIRAGKTSYVRPFPISVAYSSDGKNLVDSQLSDSRDEAWKKTLKELGLEGKKIGVGVDRIDYTKGLLERFRALDKLFEKYPKYLGEMVFVEIGAPSRTLIPSYHNHFQEVDELVQKINAKFQKDHYQPIHFLKEFHAQEEIQKFYKQADFCLVSSLHDGMNLVAKEFVASRDDENGVLILSRFTGASHEFASALQINPYDIEGTAEAIHQALTMLPEEKRERMRKMRAVVREYNVYRWAADIITELLNIF